MVSNNINRFLIGTLLVLVVFLSYLINLDFFLITIILLLTSYDLYKSKIIEIYLLSILSLLCILLAFLVPIKNFEYLFIFNLILVLIILFWPKYKKECFSICLYVFCLILFYILSIERNIFYLIILISFFNDTTAYLIGKKFGGPLILSKISPKKTWSGTLSSFILSTIILLFLNFNIIFSLIISIFLFLGDIFFSYVKRYLNLKDFSSILKSHGGILDRLDSMFFVTIIFQIYLVYLV